MRFILTIILLIVAALAIQLYYPWWAMGLTCFIIGGLMGMNGFKSFIAGFFALLLLWGGYALFLNQDNVLPTKMAELFSQLESFGDNRVYGLMGVTALLGALLGGMATMTGSLGRNIFRRKKVVVEE